MTDYRLPSNINLWSEDNSSVMEAFMSSDLSSLWPPTQSSASTPDPTKNQIPQPQPPPSSMTPFNQETLQQRLQQLIEGSREGWTYAIFWQSSYDGYSGGSVLGWGDGYYKGEGEKGKAKTKVSSAVEQEHRKKVLRELNSLISGSTVMSDDAVDEEVTDTEWFFLVSMTQSFFVNGGGLPGQAFFSNNPVWVYGPDRLSNSGCERARQAQVFGLQTMVCIPSANGVVELGSTEIIIQNSDLMNKVRFLFNFNGMELNSWSNMQNPDQDENDPSSWINDPSGVIDIKESATTALVSGSGSGSISVSNNNNSSTTNNNNNQQISASLSENPSGVNIQNQNFFSRELNFAEYAYENSTVRNGNLNSHLLKPESGEILSFGESKRSSCSPNPINQNNNDDNNNNNNLFSGDESNKKKRPAPTSRGSNEEGMLSFTSGVILPSSGVVKPRFQGFLLCARTNANLRRGSCTNTCESCKHRLLYQPVFKLSRSFFAERKWYSMKCKCCLHKKIKGPERISQHFFQFFVAFLLVTAASVAVDKPPSLALSEENLLFLEAWRTIDRAYVDKSFNGQSWFRYRENALRNEPMNNREETYTAIKKMLATLDDPFTRFLEPEKFKSLRSGTQGALTGVGLSIGYPQGSDGSASGLVVISAAPGGPANRAGIFSGDVILAIDNTSTESMGIYDAAERLQGPEGSSVELTIRSGPEIKHLELMREKVSLNPVKARLCQVPGSGKDSPRIGYIKLTSFNQNASGAVREAIDTLRSNGVNAFVLDLRDNSGGLLPEGIDIAKIWLDKGVIVYICDSRGVRDIYDTDGSSAIAASEPLAVLVNKGTASASEILAGALKDNKRAILFGEPTFGKGKIQSVFQLSDGSGLAVTVARYETPAHTDINKVGVIPDHPLPKSFPKDGDGFCGCLQDSSSACHINRLQLFSR